MSFNLALCYLPPLSITLTIVTADNCRETHGAPSGLHLAVAMSSESRDRQ